MLLLEVPDTRKWREVSVTGDEFRACQECDGADNPRR